DFFMKKWLLVFACMAFTMFLYAQENKGNISVTVTGQDQPLENATVYLLSAKDSSLVKLSLCDKNGWAIFEHILYGQYFLRATSVNFEQHQTAPFNLNTSALSLPGI